jgi:D-arabinose 1-dehydrogenase-like Zn-dependent alcohol dehydrogenase
MVGRGGVYLTMGAIVAGKECSVAPPNVIRPSKRIIGSAFRSDTLRKALQFLLSTRETYPYALVTGDQYPFELINDALADADARRAMRASIAMDKR